MTFVDHADLTYAQSLMVAVCFATLLVGAAGFSLLLAIHHARRAEAVRTPRKVPLRKGPITLHGRVRTNDGFPAIKLRIEQSGGVDVHNGKVHMGWREASRSVDVHPFEIELEHGLRVAVEAGESPVLIDDLVERRGAAHTRILQAELSHGERVCIEGELTRRPPQNGAGDSGSQGSWVLRPSPTRPMLLSTAFLAVHHTRRARVWRVTGLTCIATLIVSLWAAGSYVPLLLAGASTEVEVIAHRRESSCGRHACPRFLELATVSGEAFSEEVSASLYARVEEGDRLPVVCIPSRPWVHQLGTRPVLPEQAPLWILLLSLIPLGVGWTMHAWNIGWFTQKRVTHIQDAGYHH